MRFGFLAPALLWAVAAIIASTDAPLLAASAVVMVGNLLGVAAILERWAAGPHTKPRRLHRPWFEAATPAQPPKVKSADPWAKQDGLGSGVASARAYMAYIDPGDKPLDTFDLERALDSALGITPPAAARPWDGYNRCEQCQLSYYDA